MSGKREVGLGWVGWCARVYGFVHESQTNVVCHESGSWRSRRAGCLFEEGSVHMLAWRSI